MTAWRIRSTNHPQQVARRSPSLFPAEYGDVTDATDDRGTDPLLFGELDRRYRFTVDVAASPANAKCTRYYTRTDDGLAQSWAGERVWANPPFSDLAPWVRKAHDEMDAEVVVMLLPANRTEQPWWQTWIEPFRDRGGRLTVSFLAGRTRFTPRTVTATGSDRPPFGCCLAVWGKTGG